MNIIVISAFFHNSSCCLLQNGTLMAAAQEERFSRRKNDRRLPIRSFRHCLNEGGIDVVDVDCIAYYESPVKKLSRQLWMQSHLGADPFISWADSQRPMREIKERLGYEGQIDIFDHHLSHAAASFFFSGFEKAAILVANAVGEWTTTSFGIGNGCNITIADEIKFPNSLGLFYSAITQYFGFYVFSGEYKVMGLAPYGRPVYVNELYKLITLQLNGKYKLDMTFFNFSGKGPMYTNELVDLLGEPARTPESIIKTFHTDVAKSLQIILEEVLISQVNHPIRFVRAQCCAHLPRMRGGMRVPQKRRQGAKRGKIHMGSCHHTPARTGGPIEHPRRNLQPSIQCPAGKAAAENRHARLLDHLMDINLPPAPEMPRIKKLALITGPVGVPSSSCTTPSGRIRPWTEDRRRPRVERLSSKTAPRTTRSPNLNT